MPTQQYRTLDGKRVPGVTTVIGGTLGWNKDPLMKWANREGLAGRDITTRAPREADIGTAGHEMMERYIQGYNPYNGPALMALSEEDKELAIGGFESFLRWHEDTRMNIVATEVWSVDEEYQVGFCPDAFGVRGGEQTVKVSGRLEGATGEQLAVYADGGWLLDWKTGKGVYPDHYFQVAAYTVLLERCISAIAGRPIRLAGAIILGVRPNGMFKVIDFPRHLLDDGWLLFTYLRAIYSKRHAIEGLLR